jgi:hypothetical protein
MGCNRTDDFQGVLCSNERRLDILHFRAVRVHVDASTVLRFVLELVASTKNAEEFRRRWALNVSGLLDEVEAAHTASRAVV